MIKSENRYGNRSKNKRLSKSKKVYKRYFILFEVNTPVWIESVIDTRRTKQLFSIS